MLTYLVTGAADISPTHENLRRSGRRVRYGADVGRSASEELREGMRYVVVAHGDATGTVYWFREGEEVERPWLWVGMDPTPLRSRVYLYCCNAGPRLSRYLKSCECFGHSSAVPAPVSEARSVVLAYLGEVDRLMNGEEFHPDEWRTQLSAFVGEKLDQELAEATSLLGPSFWVALGKSLNVELSHHV